MRNVCGLLKNVRAQPLPLMRNVAAFEKCSRPTFALDEKCLRPLKNVRAKLSRLMKMFAAIGKNGAKKNERKNQKSKLRENN
jgi:hypothetical protein